MSGFYVMHRGWQNNPILAEKTFSKRDAWIWLIENAAWKETQSRIKGSTVTIERGQLSFSQRFMAEKWGWSKSKVDRFLRLLEAESMIFLCSKIGPTADQRTGQGQSIITICNYCDYQDVQTGERTNNKTQIGPTTDQQRTKEEQRNKLTSNNIKEKNTKKEKSTPFPMGWKPKPFSKGTASKNIIENWTDQRRASEVELFETHHKEKDNEFVDWQGAWSTWVIRSEKYNPTILQPVIPI